MTPIGAFVDDQRRVSETLTLVEHLNSQTVGILDSSDVLRGAFASLLSSLDLFVHSRIRQELMDQYQAGSIVTNVGRSLPVPLGLVGSVHSSPSLAWLDEAFEKKCGHLSFQDPKKISQAVSIVRDSSGLWDHVQQTCSIPEIRLQLKLQVDRRNQIVHESDRDPSDQSRLWSIDIDMVRRAAEVVDASVNGIESFLRTPSS